MGNAGGISDVQFECAIWQGFAKNCGPKIPGGWLGTGRSAPISQPRQEKDQIRPSLTFPLNFSLDRIKIPNIPNRYY